MPFQQKYTDQQIIAALETVINENKTFEEVAEKTGIHPNTLRRHRSKYLEKLGIEAGVSVPKQVKPPAPYTESKLIKEILEKTEEMRNSAPAIPSEGYKDAVEIAMTEKAEYLRDLFKAKHLVLKQIMELVPKSMNLDNLQKTLKTLSDVEGFKGGEVDAGSSSRVTNTFQYFNNILIQTGYEGPKLQESDISKGY